MILPSTIFFISFLVIVIVLFGYSFYLKMFLSSRMNVMSSDSIPEYPFVSIIIVYRNASELVQRKIENCLALEYPENQLQFVFYSDGSSDNSLDVVNTHVSYNLISLYSKTHKGKISAMNQAVAGADGDILVFSDVDALLVPNSLEFLLKHFTDPGVGGVCGQRVIADNPTNNIEGAQNSYIRFDSTIKMRESLSGSITANDGKLYAIRKEMYQEIPNSVTDDLFVCMSVVEQNRRFLFEPKAIACIKVPSRNPNHEWVRRRRIVSTSWRGIFMKKHLLNPISYGQFAIGLFVNKVLRRLLFPFFVILFLSTYLLIALHSFIKLFFVIQIIVYVCAATFPLYNKSQWLPRFFMMFSEKAYYFLLGSAASFMGVIDFLCGKKFEKWEPIKSD